MKTFEQLKQSIADYLGKDTVSLPDSIRGDMVNIAQRKFSRTSTTWYNEFSDTFVTAVSQENYSRPTGWKEPKGSFWYVVGGDRKVITFRDKAEFDVLYPEITDASNDDEPVNFTIWANQLQLGPAPDQIYTIHRNYYRVLPDLADGAPDNSNILTQEAWEVILFGALAEAESFGMDDERIPLWNTKYQEIRMEIIKSYNRGISKSFKNQSAYSR